jgi:hypothetical protein
MIKETLYFDYIKEREGLEVLENESGFITYKITGDECFIKNMFITPKMRSTFLLKNMIDLLCEIAFIRKCKFISANIDLQDEGAGRTLVAALKIGFRLARAQNDILLIIKELEAKNG